MSASSWLMTSAQRGNEATRLDARHPDGLAWTDGNEVRPLIHGSAYFAELLRCVSGMRRDDLLLFTDWRGDPDEALDDEGNTVAQVFSDAAARGVVVKGLVWRSHLDRFMFSEQENRHLGERIEAAGGECLRDMRVRPGGSHHQKFVVLRHPGRPDLDVAFVGGIDLCHSRRDGPDHHGDAQRQPMAAVYGARPPWHDVQLAVRGPAVGDVETTFRERWEDPAPLTRNPWDRVVDAAHGEDRTPGPLPPQLPDPEPRGSQTVQLLRTYPKRRSPYPFAPDGERSIAHAYTRAVSRARSLVYLEDQYLWSREVVGCFAKALRASPELRLIAVVPHHPDQDGRMSLPPNLVGRRQALDVLRRAGGDRVAIYGVENHAGTPVYVHAKVCVIDDVWASVGSDNVNTRSWTHDSELSCAVLDDDLDGREPRVVDRFGDGARTFARGLRLALAREHLDRRSDGDGGHGGDGGDGASGDGGDAASGDGGDAASGDGGDADLLDPRSAFAAFAASAQALEDWHAAGKAGPRPPGRLRPYRRPDLSRRTLAWATPLYRAIYDPDGRPMTLRLLRRY